MASYSLSMSCMLFHNPAKLIYDMCSVNLYGSIYDQTWSVYYDKFHFKMVLKKAAYLRYAQSA